METKRPTIPAAEEILGGYFPVLDHGFVALVDYMGSDADVERAARVSYGYGTRKVSATRGLIRYLRRHAHTTPSEMVELKFHCCLPMFVARQWIRHRTACLAEGTEVYFDLPGGIARRGNQLYKLRIEEIWDRFQPTRNRHRPDKQGNPFHRRERVREMCLRQVEEESLEIRHTRVRQVFRNGPKRVFRMVLADGKTIEATADHRFLFADGWATLNEATGLRARGGRAVWDAGEYFVYVNGQEESRPALYRDPDWLRREYHDEGLRLAEMARITGVTDHTIRKWLAKKGGVSCDREGIGRWTTQAAARVHRRNGWTCQLCEERASELHCHHVVPVWADESLAREEANLTTLCVECHHKVQGDELAWVEPLGGPPVKKEWKRRPRVPWNKLTTAKLVRIQRFEYVGVKETYDLEVEGPDHNFIANGIVTHNSVNEYSGRYSLLPLLFYTPEEEDFALQSAANRQGRDEPAPGRLHREAVERWERLRAEAGDTYTWLLGEDVARELARIDLPLSTYTQWYWKIDLHNLLHFLTLRVDPHAQLEIREFARVMAGMLERVAPLSYEAWLDYDLMGRRFSAAELDALRRLLAPGEGELRPRPGAETLGEEELREAGLSGREIRELLDKLRPAERPDFGLDLSRMKTAEEMAALMEAAVPDVEREKGGR